MKPNSALFGVIIFIYVEGSGSFSSFDRQDAKLIEYFRIYTKGDTNKFRSKYPLTGCVVTAFTCITVRSEMHFFSSGMSGKSHGSLNNASSTLASSNIKIND